MRGNLAYTAVILHVMQETECLFAEYGGKFLPFFHRLFVEDAPQLIECIHSISAEGRYVLCRILTDVDDRWCNGRFCGAVGTSDNGHGENRRKSDGMY